MPLVMENDARRVALERLGNADRLWTDVALPYGNRVSLTLPADLFGRSVQVFFVPIQEQEADETAVAPKDELLRSLAALPEQYAAGNWNGYDEKPLNRNSHRHAKAFAENLPKAFRNADVGIDADGEVTFEWYRAKDCQCSLTFAESGNVYCIVRKDGDKLSATIASKSVGKILDLISEVVNG